MLELKSAKVNLGTFDLVKGLAMLSIVLGHISYFDYSKNLAVRGLAFFLNAFAPLCLIFFVFISGFSFRPRSCLQILKQSASGFLVPYAWTSLAVTVLFPLIRFPFYRDWSFTLYEDLRYVLAFLFGLPGDWYPTIFGISAYEASVIYFLMVLFWVHNLLNLVLKIRKELFQFLALVLGLIISYFLYRMHFVYYCLPRAFFYLPFCYAGYWAKKHDILSKVKLCGWQYAIPAAILLFLSYLATRPNLFNISRDGTLLPVTTLFFLGMVFPFFFLAVPIGQKEWSILDPLKQIGMYSYWILCLHSVELICFPWYLWGERMSNHPLIGILIAFLVKLVILNLGCIALKKITKWNYKRRSKNVH